MYKYPNPGYNFKSSARSKASLDSPGELLLSGRTSLYRQNSGHQPLWGRGCGGNRGDPSSCEKSHLTGSHFVFQNWSLTGCLGYRFSSWFSVVTDTNKTLSQCLTRRSCHLVVRGSPGIEDKGRGQRGWTSQGYANTAQLREFHEGPTLHGKDLSLISPCCLHVSVQWKLVLQKHLLCRGRCHMPFL